MRDGMEREGKKEGNFASPFPVLLFSAIKMVLIFALWLPI